MAVRALTGHPNTGIDGAGLYSGYNFGNVGIDADEYADMRTNLDMIQNPGKYPYDVPDETDGPGALFWGEQSALSPARRITGSKTYSPTTEDPGEGEGSFTTGRVGYALFGPGGTPAVVIVAAVVAALFLIGGKRR